MASIHGSDVLLLYICVTNVLFGFEYCLEQFPQLAFSCLFKEHKMMSCYVGHGGVVGSDGILGL